jgi:hypothetical protein
MHSVFSDWSDDLPGHPGVLLETKLAVKSKKYQARGSASLLPHALKVMAVSCKNFLTIVAA